MEAAERSAAALQAALHDGIAIQAFRLGLGGERVDEGLARDQALDAGTLGEYVGHGGLLGRLGESHGPRSRVQGTAADGPNLLHRFWNVRPAGVRPLGGGGGGSGASSGSTATS